MPDKRDIYTPQFRKPFDGVKKNNYLDKPRTPNARDRTPDDRNRFQRPTRD